MAKKYKIIVVDPPWPVQKIERKVRPNQKQNLDYPTMTLEQIKDLPIADISADNSVLFLWTTHAFLPHSFAVLENWGFKYQRTITWDKQNGMCLFGFHHRTEFCLFGYRGKIEMYPEQKAIPTVFSVKSSRHSVKPDTFFNMVAVFGSPRIELFARSWTPLIPRREGWDVWGNEVESDIDFAKTENKEAAKTITQHGQPKIPAGFVKCGECGGKGRGEFNECMCCDGRGYYRA